MHDGHPNQRRASAELAGDPGGLAARLGEAGLLALAQEPAGQRALPEVRDVASLRAFLTRYRDEVLLPREIPWILRAWRCAEAFQPRELVALDQELGREPWWRELAVASRHVGRAQLRRLRPLREVRVLQRYRDAVQAGQAQGWHLVVYGVVLSVYAVPLRPGLVSYGLQTLGGFVGAAARSLRLTVAEADGVQEAMAEAVPDGVRKLLGANPPYI